MYQIDIYITIYCTSLIKYMGNLPSCCGIISKHVYPLELPKMAPFCMKITKNNSGGGPQSISRTSAATFHSAFTSVIGWRTDLHKALYVLHKVEWNSVGTALYPLYIMSNIIFKRKIICFYPHYSHTRFVYTKLRLHPQQIIRVITTLLFAKFSHICQMWNRFIVILW